MSCYGHDATCPWFLTLYYWTSCERQETKEIASSQASIPPLGHGLSSLLRVCYSVRAMISESGSPEPFPVGLTVTLKATSHNNRQTETSTERYFTMHLILGLRLYVLAPNSPLSESNVFRGQSQGRITWSSFTTCKEGKRKTFLYNLSELMQQLQRAVTHLKFQRKI